MTNDRSDAQASGSSEMGVDVNELRSEAFDRDKGRTHYEGMSCHYCSTVQLCELLDAKDRELVEVRAARTKEFGFNAHLAKRVEQLQAKLDRVRVLHKRVWANENGDAYCDECGDPERPVWPCATVQAVDHE